MDKKIYTGVGSRETPNHILVLFEEIAEKLAKDYILRSGGADGADTAFETGCDKGKGKKEIFLPWAGFNKNRSPFNTVSAKAIKMAKEVHPAWEKVTEWAQKLHGRNVYQVLGYQLKEPSNFLICWTQGGKRVGGTSTAISIAEKNGITIYNFGNKLDQKRFNDEVLPIIVDESKGYEYFF